MALSPWSERARWALDHHRIPYKCSEFVPMLSEPRLRLKLRRPSGRITVPILFADQVALRDSFDIAQHADAVGRSPTLFPSDHVGDIAHWASRLEPAMEAGRAISVRQTATSSAALRDSVPGPAWLGAVAAPMARAGVVYFNVKYALSDRTAAEDQAVLRAGLTAVRAALGTRQTLLSRFSFADILVATLLQFVRPPGEPYLRMSAATRRARTCAPVAEEFAELLDWRDRLYELYR
jgi:glutathione S-transferase